MGTLVIQGGRVVDPASGRDGVASVVVQDGRIERIVDGQAEVPPGSEMLDAAGCIVCPGFVDLHTHLRVPGLPHKETMSTGTAAAAAGGFSTVCAMANTNPVVHSPEILDLVLRMAARDAAVHVRQLAAVTLNLAGQEITDMPALAAAGAVAFSDDGKPVADDRVMRCALEIAATVGVPISVHEEDPSIVRGGVANTDAARVLGLSEWPCQGEATMVARDIALLAQTGGHLHVAHVSCAETVPLVRRAKAQGLRVTAEVTPHHLRLTDRLLLGDPALGLPPAHPCAKVNPPLRSAADVEAVVSALADGTIDAVATDHAPHEPKQGTFETATFGFSGIETALPLLLDLVRAGSITLTTMVERLTLGPARVFGLGAGTLLPGEVADVTVFDPDMPWRVESHELRSRGKNTPLLGANLTGRVTHTLVAGRVAYRLQPPGTI